MKKNKLFLIISIILVIGILMYSSNSIVNYEDNNKIYSSKMIAYVNGKRTGDIPSKNDGYEVDKIECTNNATASWDNEEWGIFITDLSESDTKCSVYFENRAKSYEIKIYGGKNEDVLITTPDGSVTKTLNNDGYLITNMDLRRGENITLKGITSNYENTVVFNNQNKLYARPEHIIFWHGASNDEYGGVSAYPFKSWSSASALSPTITSTDDYINAKIYSSGWTTYSGGWGATDLIDVTNFDSLKINVKSGYVKLNSSGNGINGGINLVSIIKGSDYDSSTGAKKELVSRIANHSDGTLVSGAGTTNMTPGVYTANISSLSGDYTVGIFMGLLYGTAEISFDELWLE